MVRRRGKCHLISRPSKCTMYLLPPLIRTSSAKATVAPGREHTDGGRDAIASAIASTVATWQVTKRHRHTWLGPPLHFCRHRRIRLSAAATANGDYTPHNHRLVLTLSGRRYTSDGGVWALASTLPEAEWMHRALLVLRA